MMNFGGTERIDLTQGEARSNRASRNARLRYCSICNKATKEGKDLCSDHIEESPYIKALLERIATTPSDLPGKPLSTLPTWQEWYEAGGSTEDYKRPPMVGAKPRRPHRRKVA